MRKGVIFIILLVLVISIVSAKEVEIQEVHQGSVKVVVSEKEILSSATTYFYAGSKLIASKENDEITYHYQDRLGSDVHSKSLPFGQEIVNNERFSFTGKELDFSGLHYFGARYYDSKLGRFTSKDPVSSELPYAYVINNPMNYVDPTGTLSVEHEFVGLQDYTHGEQFTNILDYVFESLPDSVFGGRGVPNEKVSIIFNAPESKFEGSIDTDAFYTPYSNTIYIRPGQYLIPTEEYPIEHEEVSYSFWAMTSTIVHELSHFVDQPASTAPPDYSSPDTLSGGRVDHLSIIKELSDNRLYDDALKVFDIYMPLVNSGYQLSIDKESRAFNSENAFLNWANENGLLDHYAELGAYVAGARTQQIGGVEAKRSKFLEQTNLYRDVILELKDVDK